MGIDFFHIVYIIERKLDVHLRDLDFTSRLKGKRFNPSVAELSDAVREYLHSECQPVPDRLDEIVQEAVVDALDGINSEDVTPDARLLDLGMD
jgi:hypothetical protein